MRAFRSEEHLQRWIEAGNPEGETLTLPQQWELAGRWFAGRHLPSWRKRSAEGAEAIFRSVGLSSGFWSMT